MAETPDLAIAPSLNFTQNPFRSSNFQYQTTQSNQYGSPILINSSITPVMFNMPTSPFNLSQTYVNFNVNIPQPPAGYYVWTYADCIPEIKQIQFFGPNNMLLADLDNANVYSKFVIPREMAFEDYMSNDQMNKFYPSNSLNNVVPALRNGNSVVVGEQGANPAYKNYTEQAHFNVGPINNAGLPNNVLTYQVQLPLSVYKNTLFAVNKTLYFDQITYVKIFFANIGRVCYMSTSNANPSAGAPIAWAPVNGAAVAPYNNVNITNLQLYVACESNPTEIAMIKKQVQESSIDMFIPWVQMFNNSNSGSSQSVNVQIDSGLGLYVVKIYHSIFSTDTGMALDMAYDNSNNCPGLGSNQSYKFLNGYTQWNGFRLQPIQIDSTAGNNTDYLMQRASLKGSVLDSLSQYEYSWHWLDDFSGLSPDYIQASKDDLIAGIRLDAVPKTWQFVGAQMRAGIGQAQPTTPGNTANVAETNSFSHYTFICTMKHLTISRGQIMLQ